MSARWMVRLGSLLAATFLLAPGCGGGGSSGPGSGDVDRTRVALLRLDGTIRRFSSDAQAGSPNVKLLADGLDARLLQEEHDAAARQALEIAEAYFQGRRPKLDPDFERVIGGLADLPYVGDLSATLADVRQGNAGGSMQSSSSALLKPAAYPEACSVAADCCAVDCAMDSMMSLATDIVLTGVGGINDIAEWFEGAALSGPQCAEKLLGLEECLADNEGCSRNDLLGFSNDCLGFAKDGVEAALGNLPGPTRYFFALASAATGSFIAADAADARYEQCAAYQADSCCVGKIKCGANCCTQGYSCPNGQCLKNANTGCGANEKACGAYCCPSTHTCGSSGCIPPPLCSAPGQHACGGSCCTELQSCVAGGSGFNCSTCEESLCGGTACCSKDQFCNQIGQCMDAPEGGCSTLCGTTCCPAGKSCDLGSCVGPVCGDKSCDGPAETSTTCPADCGSSCGNGDCDTWENSLSCAKDCPPKCGDELCGAGEPTSCPKDCGLDGTGGTGGSGGSGGFGGFGGTGGGGSGGTGGSTGCSSENPVDCGDFCCPSSAPVCGQGATCCKTDEKPCAGGCCPAGGTCPPSKPEDCAICCPGDSCCPSDLYCCGDCDTGC